MTLFFKILFSIFTTFTTVEEVKSSTMIIISHTSNIDMGGRMYDPVLSRFLNPDIVVQFPENSQSYNRYSYALNNPLKYTDPSGWFIDEWELDRKTGKISWLNDNKHYIERDGQQVEVDKLINSIGNYIDLSKGILGRNMGDDFQSYAFSNAVEAEDFYYFVAGSSNVEWAFMESKYGTGEVGADYGEGSTKMPGLYENTHSNTIKRMSHSHPPGGDGHPSYNVGGKDIGDLNNAKKSLYDYKREVYDVVNDKIYEYSRNTTFPHWGERAGNRIPNFDKERKR